MTNMERIAELKAQHEKQIHDYNAIFRTGTGRELSALEDAIKKTEADYLKVFEADLYDSFETVEDALKAYTFYTISHSRETVEGQVVGFQSGEKRMVINLKALCEQKDWDTKWWFEMQAFNLRMLLRQAKSIGKTPDELRRINSSYKMDKYAKEIELGKSPESNTQCVKHLQTVLDGITGGHGLKVNNHDLAFIDAAYSKMSNKEDHTLVCMNHKDFLKLITNVCSKVVRKRSYGLSYKAEKDALPTPVKAEPPVEAPAAVDEKAA